MSNKIESLRKSAKNILKDIGSKKFDLKSLSNEEAIEELNIYHIELEMQIEELKKNREQLEFSLHYLKFLFENAPIGYLIFDVDGVIHDVNSTAVSFFNTKREFLINRKVQQFIIAEYYPTFLKFFKRLISTKKNQYTELQFRKINSNKFWARIDIAFHNNPIEKSEMILCSIMDINAQKKVEEELQNNQAQLTHAGRLASLGEMATGVAHELNQPLSRIRLNAQYLDIHMNKENINLNNSKDDYINRSRIIMKEVDRAANIINHMRGYARIGDDMVEDVNVIDCIRSSMMFFKEQFKNHDIIYKEEFDCDPTVTINAQKFEQVLFNILSNARYAVDEKGRSDEFDNYKKEILLKLFFKANNYIIIEIIDNGIGMNEETKNRCLDPFYTTKKVGDGTGLGLSIAFNIIKEFEGWIEIESENKKGSKIGIILPVSY